MGTTVKMQVASIRFLGLQLNPCPPLHFTTSLDMYRSRWHIPLYVRRLTLLPTKTTHFHAISAHHFRRYSSPTYSIRSSAARLGGACTHGEPPLEILFMTPTSPVIGGQRWMSAGFSPRFSKLRPDLTDGTPYTINLHVFLRPWVGTTQYH